VVLEIIFSFWPLSNFLFASCKKWRYFKIWITIHCKRFIEQKLERSLHAHLYDTNRVVHTRGSGQHSYAITQHIRLPGSLSKYAVTRQFIKIHCTGRNLSKYADYQEFYQNTLLRGSLSKYAVTRQFIKIHCFWQFIKIRCFQAIY